MAGKDLLTMIQRFGFWGLPSAENRGRTYLQQGVKQMLHPQTCPYGWTQLQELLGDGTGWKMYTWQQVYGMAFDRQPLGLKFALPTGVSIELLWGITDGEEAFTVNWYGDEDGYNWLTWYVARDFVNFEDGCIGDQEMQLEG
jgi:hypothetical protein